MTEAPSRAERADGTAVRGIRSLFSLRMMPVWISAAVLAVGVGALIAIGAFDTAHHEPDAVAIGDEVRLSTYTVTVLDVEVTDAVDEQYLEADPGESLLLVTLRLENLTDATVSVVGSADRVSSRLINATAPLLDLTGVGDPGTALVWNDIASPRYPLLQPDVPAEITAAWRVSTAELEKGAAAIEVHDAIERAGQIIVSSDVVSWTQGALIARVDLEAQP